MKKSTLVLCAILCAGLAPNSSHAQPAQPTTYAATLSAGQRDFKAEDYEAATKDAESLLTLATSPQQTGDALTLLGETYHRRKMYGEAQTQWAKMLELPETGENEGVHLIAHLGSARSYSAQGQWDKAVPEYQSVISQTEAHLKTDGDANPTESKQTLAPFYFALANAYSHNKQYDLAQQQLKQVIQYSEGDSPFRLLALTQAGEIDVLERKFGDAADNWKRALEMSPAPTDPAKAGSIRALIPLLESLDKQQLGAGQANDGKLKINVEPPKEIDEATNAIITGTLDIFFDGFISDSSEE